MVVYYSWVFLLCDPLTKACIIVHLDGLRYMPCDLLTESCIYSVLLGFCHHLSVPFLVNMDEASSWFLKDRRLSDGLLLFYSSHGFIL